MSSLSFERLATGVTGPPERIQIWLGPLSVFKDWLGPDLKSS